MTERDEFAWTKDVEFIANEAKYRITVCSKLHRYTASVVRIDLLSAPVVPIFLNDPPRTALPFIRFGVRFILEEIACKVRLLGFSIEVAEIQEPAKASGLSERTHFFREREPIQFVKAKGDANVWKARRLKAPAGRAIHASSDLSVKSIQSREPSYRVRDDS